MDYLSSAINWDNYVRHVALAQSSNRLGYFAHHIVAVIEAIPGIGYVAFKIEKIVSFVVRLFEPEPTPANPSPNSTRFQREQEEKQSSREALAAKTILTPMASTTRPVSSLPSLPAPFQLDVIKDCTINSSEVIGRGVNRRTIYTYISGKRDLAGFAILKNPSYCVSAIQSGQIDTIQEKDLESPDTLDAALQRIFGKTLADIEKSARPRNGYSSIGFIGEQESLFKLLTRDSLVVKSLKSSHLQLGYALHELFSERNQKMYRYGRSDEIVWNNQHYNIQDCRAKNTQGDLFGRPSPKGGPNYFITNLSNGVKIFYTDHTLCYIYQLGLYQGGENGITYTHKEHRSPLEPSDFVVGYYNEFLKIDRKAKPGFIHNPYRIPPELLYALITGESLESVQAKIAEVLASHGDTSA